MILNVNGQVWNVEPYDVIQISACPDRWEDYATIRHESDARYAIGMVTRHPTVYRIVRGGHKEVIRPERKPKRK